ncbi:MAG: pyridoxal phosphate-dependent aminotransferase, partial [Treponemataceae bacterium]|nr:pyridoxal phosphate-dependent aminotransferase [Treponemataceae bacterium]
MTYDFSLQERHGTDCAKFDLCEREGRAPDTLCYWVADVDFKTAPEILDAITERVQNGVFGYTTTSDAYTGAVAGWWKNNYQYTVQPEWIVPVPGVVFAFTQAILAFTQPGDAVLIQRPVYYPFGRSIENTGRKLVNSPLLCSADGKYTIDFADFEAKITENGVKLFILCNPANPIGRSWKRDELQKMADICLKHDVLIVSDEIHSDFVWDDNKHTVTASLSPEIEQKTVTCTAPSKTFNLAGLQCSNIFIANPTLREAYKKQLSTIAVNEPNLLALTACRAAYEKGGPWLAELKALINDNLNKAVAYIAEHGKGKLKARKIEATYLLWVDCSGCGMTGAQMDEALTKAGIWLDGGSMFGPEGDQFQRVNCATTWEYLEQGLNVICKTLAG